MSNPFLYVWDGKEHGIPKDINDAASIVQTLETLTPTQPSRSLLAFAQRVQDIVRFDRRLSSSVTLPYMSLGEQALQHRYPFMVLEQPSAPEVKFLPLLVKMVEAACAFGVVIVYDNRGMVFLPSGEIFPPIMQDWWIGVLDYLETTKGFNNLQEYKAYVEPLATAIIAKHPDYIKGERYTAGRDVFGAYVRKTAIGLQRFGFYYTQNKYGYAICGVKGGGGGVQSPMVNRIYQYFDFPAEIRDIGTFPLIFTNKSVAALAGDTPFVEYAKNTLQAQQQLAFIEKTVFAFFDMIKDIKGLDAVLNGNEMGGFFRDMYHRNTLNAPIALIVARLANNPQFEELAVKLATPKSMGDINGKVYPTEYPKLVKYLREEINPDTFWQQYAELEAEEKRLEEARVKVLQEQFQPKTHEELMSLASQWHDPETGLIWQQCCIGQQWQDGEAVGGSMLLYWQEVQQLLEQPEHVGWRLPSLEELQTLHLSKRVGYITKEGITFYDKKQRRIERHWFTSPEDTGVASVTQGESPYVNSLKQDAKIEGYVRLVKSAC